MKNLSSFFTLAALLTVATPVYADICSDGRPSCKDLGFTQDKSSCKGKFNVCPWETDKVICIDSPSVGDIKHSLQSKNHDGWLLCDGSYYSTSDYKELYNLIGTKFGSSAGKFKVPDYRGYFLRGYGAASINKPLSSYGGNANNSLYSAQSEQLPNFTGTFPLDSNARGSGKLTGALQDYNSSDCGKWSGHKTGGAYLTHFTASKTLGTGKGVYKENGHVIPGNYATYIFIYAGK